MLALMEEDAADAYTAEKEAAAQAEQDEAESRGRSQESGRKKQRHPARNSLVENKVTKIASGFLGVVVLIALGGRRRLLHLCEAEAEKAGRKKPLTPMQITPRTRAILKFLWRMNRKKPVRGITQNPSDFNGGVCRRTYYNLKQNRRERLFLILVVAEKALGRGMSYAKVLGATNRQDGYLGRATAISSAGAWVIWWNWLHPMSTMPNTSSGALQICPSCRKGGGIWCLRPPKTVWHPAKLMHRPDVDSIVNSCDSGREGVLVYQQAGCKKPFSRLWLSSMEENAIREGFAHLKPSTEYDALYNAALCRERADWMVGINASRLFSCLYNQPLAVGRVMTPVLAMTVVREAAIAAFVPEKFYTVALTLADGGTASSKRFAQKADAELLLSKCRKEGRATVQKMERKEKSESPPQLYDLTALQRDANRLLGFTAQQTLDYAQSLYENGSSPTPAQTAAF